MTRRMSPTKIATLPTFGRYWMRTSAYAAMAPTAMQMAVAAIEITMEFVNARKILQICGSMGWSVTTGDRMKAKEL